MHIIHMLQNSILFMCVIFWDLKTIWFVICVAVIFTMCFTRFTNGEIQFTESAASYMM